ncbi:hypothetical protein F2P81_012529 [Scophthalmus maximus]|uniref:PX domain-containing protein n=1 Tax=Scophthalmus maximus TaxID=52904 RepID=A0A6A4SUQ2_SCOMX|nr:hypothetical protein F2P81_012529 [Scophthalmus maximus]
MSLREKPAPGRLLLDDTVPLTAVIEASQNLQSHTEYIVRVQRGVSSDNSWQVCGISLPLPPKKLIGNMDREFIAERQRGLQAFLDSITQHPLLCSSLTVKKFLDPNNYCANYTGSFTLVLVTTLFSLCFVQWFLNYTLHYFTIFVNSARHEIALQQVSMFFRSDIKWEVLEPLRDIVSVLQSILSTEACKSGMPTVLELIRTPLFSDVQLHQSEKLQIKVSSRLKEALKTAKESLEKRLQEEQRVLHQHRRLTRAQSHHGSEEEKKRRKILARKKSRQSAYENEEDVSVRNNNNSVSRCDWLRVVTHSDPHAHRSCRLVAVPSDLRRKSPPPYPAEDRQSEDGRVPEVFPPHRKECRVGSAAAGNPQERPGRSAGDLCAGVRSHRVDPPMTRGSPGVQPLQLMLTVVNT